MFGGIIWPSSSWRNRRYVWHGIFMAREFYVKNPTPPGAAHAT